MLRDFFKEKTVRIETKVTNFELVAFIWKFVTFTKLDLEFIRSEKRRKETVLFKTQKNIEYENVCFVGVNIRSNENIVHSRSITN